jgi:hypothetical protein
MNEKQAKRLRRAARLWTAIAKKELTKGPSAEVVAKKFVTNIRSGWWRLTHRGRGRVGRLLVCGELFAAAMSRVS